eukprot:scaffold2657_cov89-Amphora_coffeaeformis.AAC.20
MLLVLVLVAMPVHAWLPLLPPSSSVSFHRSSSTLSRTVIFSDASTSIASTATSEDDDDDEEEEYEYVEYDALTEAEFVDSEWLVGTNWDRDPSKIEETWVRLVVSEDGKNLCYWGDNSEGKWSLDVASQFLSISKESLFGKQIWAGVVDDFYFMQGTVRGWTYLMSAQVLAQWQAKRLGVDPDEAGTPPWFEEQEENEQESNGKEDSN